MFNNPFINKTTKIKPFFFFPISSNCHLVSLSPYLTHFSKRRFASSKQNFIPYSLVEAGLKVLSCSDAKEKAQFTQQIYHQWNSSNTQTISTPIEENSIWNKSSLNNLKYCSMNCFKEEKISSNCSFCDSPISIGTNTDSDILISLPKEPNLLPPVEMPSFKKLGVGLEEFLLHSLAHIEHNALISCWDSIIRFSSLFVKNQGTGTNSPLFPIEFYSNWLRIAADEGRHFLWLVDELETTFGKTYGSMPAHNSLFNLINDTKDDPMKRISIMQMVQEARGLDSHERLVKKLINECNKRKSGNSNNKKIQAKRDSWLIVDQICKEEVEHVQFGLKWFVYLNYVELKQNEEFFVKEEEEKEEMNKLIEISQKRFHSIVLSLYPKGLHGPFNEFARNEAKMFSGWYQPINSDLIKNK